MSWVIAPAPTNWDEYTTVREFIDADLRGVSVDFLIYRRRDDFTRLVQINCVDLTRIDKGGTRPGQTLYLKELPE